MEFWNEPAFDVPVASEEAEHSKYDDDLLDAPCSRHSYICASCRVATSRLQPCAIDVANIGAWDNSTLGVPALS